MVVEMVAKLVAWSAGKVDDSWVGLMAAWTAVVEATLVGLKRSWTSTWADI